VLGNHNRLSASLVALARDLAGIDEAGRPVPASGRMFERWTGRRKS